MPRRVRVLKKKSGYALTEKEKKLMEDIRNKNIDVGKVLNVIAGQWLKEQREWDKRGLGVGISPSMGALSGDKEYDRREMIKRKEEELLKR